MLTSILERNEIMNLPNGTLLQGGKYRIECVLGQGGFGITYRAVQVLLGREVAIKELFLKGVNERDSDCSTVSVSNADNKEHFEQQRSKFLKEARRLSGLRNNHIVMVHDLFEENDTAYYVMDYVEGKSIRELIDQQGCMDEQMAWNCLNQMLDALDEIHNNNIWHLDIKPANIMLDKNGNLSLIDFGASKMVQSDATMNTSIVTAYTPGYAPIEQVSQKVENYGPWTDFYALGATLYNIITGSTPQLFDDIVEHGNQAFNFSDNIDSRLRELIIWMMQTNRNKRPQSVDEIRQWLNGKDDLTIQQVVPVAQQPSSSIAPAISTSNSSKISKKKWLWPVVALAFCLLCVGCYYGYKIYKKSQIDYMTYNPELVAAANDGNADAQAALAYCFLYGQGVNIDDKKAFEFYQKSAESNSPLGIYGLGVCYYNGYGIERDTIKGNDYFNQAGKMLINMKDSDNPEIIRCLGVCYFNGYGVNKNHDKAIGFYRKAVELGSIIAQCNLGYCYYAGEGVAKDYEEAVKWYRKAAEQGDEIGQHNLGVCYYYGEGVQQDFKEAVKWYRKAAEQGLAYAQFGLGECYYYGEGVAKDFSEAVKWYRKAAEQGLESAQLSLGYSYDVGEGVKKDYQEAVKWYRKAAEQGDSDAQLNLGYCYDKGHGVAKDEKEAIYWYQKSARQGNKTAQQNLRIMGKSW